MNALSIVALPIAVLLSFAPNVPLYSQSTDAVIYYNDSKVLSGTVIEQRSGSKTVFYFTENKKTDAIQLNPLEVNRFALIRKGNNKTTRIFIAAKQIENQFSFFERLIDGGISLYKSTDGGQYYLRNGKEGLMQSIPQEKAPRKDFFEEKIDRLPKIINQSAYVGSLKAIKKNIHFLNHPSGRYPAKYLGLRASAGTYKSNNITRNTSAVLRLPADVPYNLAYKEARIYLNEGLGKKGKYAYEFGLGGQVIKSKDHYETASTITFNTSLTLRRYFLTRSVFPFLGLGLRGDYLIQEDALLAYYERVDNDWLLKTYPLKSYQTFIGTPVLEVGLEIPVKNQYFISLIASGRITRDAAKERVSLFDFSIGINLF
jgi:hypothetical protein